MPTMKAVRVHAYGGPEVLTYEDAPRPEAGPGEVVVAVHAAGVNPVDWKARAGYIKDYVRYALPMTPGVDFSGVVAAIGAGVSGVAIGDEVYGQQDWTNPNGSYAEYLPVKAGQIARKPRSIDHVHAAAVPVVAPTAWQALFGADGIDPKPGKTILINGAAGGVGSFAVQFAKWAGASVIGTGSAGNGQFLRELGVDRFIDYTKEPLDSAGQVDAVFDTVGGEGQTRLWSALKPGGVFASTVGAPPDAPGKPEGARGVAVMGNLAIPKLSRIAELIDQGVIKPIVSEVFVLADARKAHELSQTGHVRGKIVLRVRD
jgi:NADPH:quinone reductase-like Zn-dependent oxidoreductase